MTRNRLARGTLMAAGILGISSATAKRCWTYARAWLYQEISGPEDTARRAGLRCPGQEIPESREPIRSWISHYRVGGRKLCSKATPMTEETIFEAALALCDPAERSAYLDGACGGDPGLRRRVEALLASEEKMGDFLERPAAERWARSRRGRGRSRAPSHTTTTRRSTSTSCSRPTSPARWAGSRTTRCSRCSARVGPASC